MKNLDKRLSKVESKMKPKKEPKGAHVVMKNTDGSVTVKLPNSEGTVNFDTEAEADDFMSTQDVQGPGPLEVIIVNSQGPQPVVETFE